MARLDQLSDPSFETEWEFVGFTLPLRFSVRPYDAEDKWLYHGREKFRELVHKCEALEGSQNVKVLWPYGSRGYGKSYVLAALVYLAALDGAQTNCIHP